jgi:ketosteroid isomerase-like protein
MTTASRDLAREHADKDRLREAFDAWAAGTGGPFGLLADEATWTIVGNSPVSRTYRSKAEFIDTVIDPFNARMSAPLVPRVRGLFADGDWVVVLFDAHATARDGQPYQNTYTWYVRFDHERAGEPAIVEVIAFFDTVEFTDFWQRVTPA